MSFIKYWNKGIDFLGSQYPLLCGAMAWVSERNLVSAISNAGGFGVIAGGSLSPIQLSEEIQATKKLTNKPFGVNIILMHPKLDELIDVCRIHNVSHVFLSAGIPNKNVLENIKSFDAKVICFAQSAKIAKRFIDNGIDAIIIEGHEAGGHIGPVSTSVLVQEILPEICNLAPVFVAGGIGSAQLIKMYIEMGAAGCQMGTMFVCAEEAITHINAKNVFINANSRDAITSIQIDKRLNVIPVRALKNAATDKFIALQKDLIQQIDNNNISVHDAQMKIEYFWSGALKKAIVDGDVDNGSLMAGQSVGLVHKISSCKEIITSIVESLI